MDSSGSLERTSRLRFALQTASRQPGTADSEDGIADHRDRPDSSDLLTPSGAASSSPSNARSRGDRSGAFNSGQIVLLIEDNLEVVTAVVDYLQEAGYQIQCVADVEDAVRKVKNRAVALVLLNWGLLLRIGGSDLIRQLRESSPRARLPMVVISDEVSALNEASSLGIEDYVLDPFQLEDLLHVVDEHCC